MPKKLGLYGRMTDNTNPECLLQLFTYIKENDIELYVDHDYFMEINKHILYLPENSKWIKEFPTPPDLDKGLDSIDVLICIGGDGTIVECSRLVAGLNINVIGVNAGRLGYLTEVKQEDVISAIENYYEGANWQVKPRSMLKVKEKDLHALNDITIGKAASNEMITIDVFVDGSFLNAYWADGLIISTPTGSTAYSLACGGPIISPLSSDIVITPIAPHSLTVRPIVVSKESVIKFSMTSRLGKGMVTVDNQSFLIDNGKELTVTQSSKTLKLVNFNENDYFQLLRTKLNWGLDSRN